MKNYNTFILLITLCLISTAALTAQDSTNTKKSWEWEWDEFEDWIDWKSKSPTISFHYGISDLSRKDLSTSFEDNALLELKLGYTSLRNSRYARFINNYRYNYLFFTKNSTELKGNSDSQNKIETDNWRIGFARSRGYAYKLGENAFITPYFTSSLDWTRIEYSKPDQTLIATDEETLNMYDKTFRFGTSSEGGVRVQPAKFITLEAGYERSIVFERHLFWKWAGSGIIELAAQGSLDAFIREILKYSPEAGPVVYLILKSALGYALYELRQDKMNWPFNSASPIAFDNIKFGVTFIF
jgi:hypothetical protein